MVSDALLGLVSELYTFGDANFAPGIFNLAAGSNGSCLKDILHLLHQTANLIVLCSAHKEECRCIVWDHVRLSHKLWLTYMTAHHIKKRESIGLDYHLLLDRRA